MLTAGELDAMRRAVAELMPDTCTILTAIRTSDGQGGYTEAWGTAVADVPCRLDVGRRENREFVSGDVLAPYSWWQLTLPYDTEITAGQRVSVAGDEYEVIFADRSKSWAVTTRVYLTRVAA